MPAHTDPEETHMRILFVAMIDSVHTARWVSQVADQGWELYLFPVQQRYPHPLLRNITVFGATARRPGDLDASVRYLRRSSLSFYWDVQAGRMRRRAQTKHKDAALRRAIKKIKPDIIHTLEFQHAGYMALRAKKRSGDPFPTWIATNWGSDIFHFGKLAEHRQPIREVLQHCNYYSCECRRDIQLARAMGFRGRELPVLPNAGGLDIGHAAAFRQPGPTSGRKTILVKGYQGAFGRALVSLQAFRLCRELLQDYTIVIYSAGEEVLNAARRFELETGIKVLGVPKTSHEEILRLFGRARIYIGLSISDGISTSLLEAMVMGAFPIQSCTACADEWLSEGQSGLIVPPEDPAAVAAALRRALADDTLVDRAAAINARTAAARLDQNDIKPQVINMYRDILAAMQEQAGQI
jgi:glycosyltransferase involved in cell wall biosynthesis